MMRVRFMHHMFGIPTCTYSLSPVVHAFLPRCLFALCPSPHPSGVERDRQWSRAASHHLVPCTASGLRSTRMCCGARTLRTRPQCGTVRCTYSGATGRARQIGHMEGP